MNETLPPGKCLIYRDSLCTVGTPAGPVEALFLGVAENGFTGGRLSEHLDDGQCEHVDDIAGEVHAALRRVEAACGDAEAADPFGFLLRLKRDPCLPF